MALYRIVCMNKEHTDAFAELVTDPLRWIDGHIYYTDYRGRSWCCDYDAEHGRLVADPEIITCCSKGIGLYRIIPGTGTPAALPLN